MRLSRRKMIFTGAWVIALAAVGMGVAIGLPEGSIQPSITIKGAATFERPVGKTLLKAAWGAQPGQFRYDNWEGGKPSENPFEIAVSPDNSTIAILDYANSRVQLFSREGAFRQCIPVEGQSLADVTFDKSGKLLVLSYADYVLRIDPKNPGKASKLMLASGLMPSELAVDGPDVKVRGRDGYYQLETSTGVVQPEKQTATADVATPAGGNKYQVAKKSRSSGVVIVTDGKQKTAKEIRLNSPELPLSEVRALGSDQSGNVYVMAHIYDENWKGTESWCFIGVSPDGKCLGQVRLPLDSYAGSGWTVAPDGKIIAIRSTKEGLEVIEYGLEAQQ